MMGSSKTTKPSCILDDTVLNENTVGDLQDIGLSIFAVLCGQNRGAFVLDPPDKHTYSCLDLPKAFGIAAGLENATMISTANDISKSQY